jgi:IS30 family transposase
MSAARQPRCSQRLKAGKRAGWQHERLLAIQWGLEGEVSLEQVADRLGRARSCIQRW